MIPHVTLTTYFKSKIENKKKQEEPFSNQKKSILVIFYQKIPAIILLIL